VRIWQTGGKTGPLVIRDARKEVTCCAISPDGSLLAVAGPDPVIRLYFLPGGSAAGTIPQVPGKPTAMTFTDNGLQLAAGYENGSITFYSLDERSAIRTLHPHAGAVTGIVAVAGKERIVSSGTDGMVRVLCIPFLRPLSGTTFSDLALARDLERAAETDAMAEQWQFLSDLLSIRFQNEIGICPAFSDAGMYDIQIVG
jgi:WD40 repeat protein